MFGVEAKITGNLVFLSTQLFVSKFLDRSTLLAHHEAMATFYSIQATLHESTAG